MQNVVLSKENRHECLTAQEHDAIFPLAVQRAEEYTTEIIHLLNESPKPADPEGILLVSKTQLEEILVNILSNQYYSELAAPLIRERQNLKLIREIIDSLSTITKSNS